jgi:hypothetical protein
LPFDYYNRLNPRQRATYRRSDAVHAVRLPSARGLRAVVDALGADLEAGGPGKVEATAQRLCDGITDALSIEPVDVEVLEVRPSFSRHELHGLYTPEEAPRPRIRVWMRTAARARVVAHRTFVRTLVHELCHHLDYALLTLDESFHTEGFFKRESSLCRQLLPPAPGRGRRPPSSPSSSPPG